MSIPTVQVTYMYMYAGSWWCNYKGRTYKVLDSNMSTVTLARVPVK